MSRHRSRYTKHRDDLTGKHALADAGQLILAVLFLAIWITDSFVLRYTTLFNDNFPAALQLTVGIILLITSAYLAWTGLKTVFHEDREKPCVIREGIFGIIRHPVYLSEILLYLGLLFLSTSLAAALIWVIAILFLYYISRYEERLLLVRFGDEYRHYMHDVPMWLPRLGKKKKKQLLK